MAQADSKTSIDMISEDDLLGQLRSMQTELRAFNRELALKIEALKIGRQGEVQ